MHPAKSVIFFTTASGAGYGLLVWLALLAPFGLLPEGALFVVISFALAIGLVVAGLLSSTFHLGHPERAWRAMSQWRTSWLSREGLAAIFTFAPAFLWGISALWSGFGSPASLTFGFLTAALSLVTVYCTGMIYACLKTIPAWHNDLTRLAYPLFSLTTGAGLGLFILSSFGAADLSGFLILVIMLFAAGAVVKLSYWASIDAAAPVSTAESATGLGDMGAVRLLEKPHSGTNYLMREMGFEIARKHAVELRGFCMSLGFLAPVLLFLVGLGLPEDLPLVSFVAAVLAGVGIVLERWLFFAEAKHVVTLYYGQSAV
ncbi:MAG: DmsC/YnfH family molybdoenzyme membrane anchor subunit [Pseudomonadota bacterium]